MYPSLFVLTESKYDFLANVWDSLGEGRGDSGVGRTIYCYNPRDEGGLCGG